MHDFLENYDLTFYTHFSDFQFFWKKFTINFGKIFQPILQAEEPFEVSKHPYDTLENHNEKYKKKISDIGKVLESGPTVMVAVGYPGKLANHRL